jgi:hypothetical protein
MIRCVQGMVPRIGQPEKNREIVSVYSGYMPGVEVIQRTVAVDFPAFVSSAARAKNFKGLTSGERHITGAC